MNAHLPAPKGSVPRDTITANRNVLNAHKRIKKLGGTPSSDPYIIDLAASASRETFRRGEAPCLTASHAGERAYWATWLGKRLDIKQLMKLQGYDNHPKGKPYKVNISDRRMGHILGNAMSVNVLERVLVRALHAAGLTRKRLPDRWQS